MLKPETGKSSR